MTAWTSSSPGRSPSSTRGRSAGPPRPTRIAPGTVLRLWTEDAFSGRLQRATHLPSHVLDMTEVNPQLGALCRGGRAG